MPTRSNIDVEEIVKVGFSDQNTIKELNEGILWLRDHNQKISDNPSLELAIRHVFGIKKISINDINDFVEVQSKLRKFNEERKIEEIVGEKEVEIVVGEPGRDEFESRSLNASELKELLRQLDEHEEKIGKENASKQSIRDQITALKKNYPELGQIKVREIERVLEKKRDVERREVAKGKSTEEAESLAEDVILIQQKIIEGRPEVDAVTAEIMAEAIAESREQIRWVAPEVDQTTVENLTTQLVLGNEKETKRIAESLPLKEEPKNVVKEILEENNSIIRFKLKVESEVERIYNLHQDTEEETSAKEVSEAKAEIRKEIVHRVENFLGEEEEKTPIKFALDENGKLVARVADEKVEKNAGETVLKGTARTIQQKPRNEKEEAEVGMLKKDIGEAAKKLRAESDSAGSITRKIKEDLIGRRKHGEIALRQVEVISKMVIKPQEYERARAEMEKAGFNDTQIKRSLEPAEISRKLIDIKGKLGKISETAETVAEINKLTKGKIKIVDKLDKGIKAISSKVGLQNLQFVQDAMKFKQMLNPMTWVAKIPGLETVGSMAGQSTWQMSAAIASQIEAQGLRQGIMFSIKNLIIRGGVPLATAGEAAATAGATAAAGAAAETGATVAVEAAVGVSTAAFLPALLVFLAVVAVQAAVWAVGKAFEFFEDKINGVLKPLSLDDGTRKVWLKENFGGFVGGIMNFGFRVVEAVGAFFLFKLAWGWALALIAGGLTFPFWGTSDIDDVLLSLTPNNTPVGGAYCIFLGTGESGGSGTINCNIDRGPQATGTTVDRDHFADVAEMWRAGGKQNAFDCFNDVVRRAQAAGINPDYALWTWLHESGASNYKGFGSAVADFGVIFAAKNDFNAQITAFLPLDPASKCVNDPLIGGDYWLAFATNFLTGGCDPTVEVQGWNGYKYKDEMVATWGWITSAPMPSSIHVTGGGGGGGGSTKNLKKIFEDGGWYLCEVDDGNGGGSTPDKPLPTLDPNIEIPEGCPNGLPLEGDFGTITSNITQGPHCQKYTHKSMVAVDFGIVATIISTHDGIARVGSNGVYGNFVDVTGKCNGVTFTTRYAHMPDGGPKVGDNVVVHKGQPIGVVDNTGNSTGPHLHYDFRNLSGSLPISISSSLGLSYDLDGCCDRISCNNH